MAKGQLQKGQLGPPTSARMIEAARHRHLLRLADMDQVSFDLFEVVCAGVLGMDFFNDAVFDAKVFLKSALAMYVECAAPPEGHPWFDPAQPPEERETTLALLEELSALDDLQAASLFEAAKKAYGHVGELYVEQRRVIYRRMLRGGMSVVGR